MTLEIKHRHLVEAFRKAAAFADADLKSTYVYIDPTQKQVVWQTTSREHVPESALICIEVQPNYTHTML